MSKIISVIVPLYNEEESLLILYERLKKVLENIQYDYEILFVNDGSRDKSLDMIKNLRQKDKKISYINLARNFGKEVAMAAAFDYVVGDATVIIDADLQDPPELIYEMIKYWEQGYDDVYAKRRSRQGETFVKKITSKLFYRILKKMSSIDIQEDTGDFRLISRRFVDELKKMKETQRYTKGMFSWVGLNKKEIYFDRDARIAGRTKWNYFKLCELAIEGMTSFTTTPLKFSSLIGIIVSLFAFIYLAIIILKTLILGIEVAGYASLISVILFLSGVQLLSLGIIGEYLGRIFIETKNRPLYIVNEYQGMKNEETLYQKKVL